MDGVERKIDDLGPHLIAVMAARTRAWRAASWRCFHQQLAAQTRVVFFPTAGLMLTLAAMLGAG